MLVKKRGAGASGIFTYFSEAFIYLKDNSDDLRYLKHTLAEDGVLHGEVALLTGQQRDWADMPMGVLRSSSSGNYSVPFDAFYADHCAELDKKLLEEV